MPSSCTTMLMAAAMGVLAVVSSSAAAAVHALQAVPVQVPAAVAEATRNGAPFVRVPFHPCSEDKTLLSEPTLTASSWPPQVGVDTLLQLSGQLNADLPAGTYSISASYLGQPLTESTGDIGTFVDLPAAPGDLTIASTLSLPSGSPAGPYSMRLEFDSQAGGTLTCVAVKFMVDRERPSILPASDAAVAADASSSEVKVLQPLFDSALDKMRADAAADSVRFEQATRIADSLNGDIEVPRITVAAQPASSKTAGAVQVSGAAQKSA